MTTRNRTLTRLIGHGRMAAVALAAALAFPLCSQAAWPERSVTLVVPYAAGGNTDIMARMAAQELTKTFGQTFIVENIVGAGGALGAQNVARATPDGYTLLFASTAQLSILPFVQKVSYDPTRDLVPIAVFGQSFSVLGIHKSVAASDLAGLVAWVKANPGKVNYATGGVGTVGHLVTASFAARAGLDMVHVPYKGGSAAMTDLLSGQVQVYFGNSSELLPFYKGQELKLLAVGTPQRVSQFPDVPTVAETYPGFSLPAWNGLIAPRGTPQPIIDALEKQIRESTRAPAIVQKLRDLGIEAGGPSGADLIAFVQGEQVTFKDAVRAAGMLANP